MRGLIRTLVGVLAAVAVGGLAPDSRAWRAVVHGGTGSSGRVDDLAVIVAGAVLWLLAIWVLAVVLAASLASMPGVVGRLGRTLVGACVLRVLRGIVLGGVAGGLLLGPAVAATAVPVWPTTPPASASPTPGPAWPVDPAAPAPAPPPDAVATAIPTAPGPASNPAAVVVAPGDSLWSISSAALTRAGTAPTAARIAATWPSWYAANRTAIGPDPGLLHPGTPLTPPTIDGSTP